MQEFILICSLCTTSKFVPPPIVRAAAEAKTHRPLVRPTSAHSHTYPFWDRLSQSHFRECNIQRAPTDAQFLTPLWRSFEAFYQRRSFRKMRVMCSVKLLSLKKLWLTVIDFSRPLTQCHQSAGINNVSPGSITHSYAVARSKRGKRSKSGCSGSTFPPYRKSESSGEKRIARFLPWI